MLAPALEPRWGSRNLMERAQALAAVAERLPSDEALAVARAIELPGWRAVTLAAVAERLPLEDQASMVTEALNFARTVEDAEERAEALAAVAERLPAEDRAGVVGDALSSARGIKREKPHRRRSFREADRRYGCCSSLSGRPNGAERLGRSGDHILDLARRHAGRKQGENDAGGGFRINAWIVIHGLVNACAERIEALRRAMGTGASAFIVEAAQQRGQLRAKIHDLVARQRVAQSVQRADQRGVGLAAIAPTQALRQIVDPGVRFGDGAADFLSLSQPTAHASQYGRRSQ